MINIAIAEDYIEHQQLLTNYLMQHDNFNILFIANNGIQMLEKLANTKLQPDVAIVDYEMNPMDGLQLTKYLNCYHSSIKTLALSSHDHLYAIENMFKCGANGYKTKAFLSKFARQRSDFENSLKMFYNSIQTVACNEYYLDETFGLGRNIQFSFDMYNPFLLWQQQNETSKTRILKLGITQQEYKILYLFSVGCSEKTIANLLYIEDKTINNHLQKIYKKLQVHSSKDLVSQVYRYELVPCAKLEFAAY